MLEQLNKVWIGLFVEHTLVLLSDRLVVFFNFFLQNALLALYLRLLCLQLFLALFCFSLLFLSELLLLELFFVGLHGGLNLVVKLVYLYQLLSDLFAFLKQFLVLFFLGQNFRLLFLFNLSLPLVDLAHFLFDASSVFLFLERALFLDFFKFGERFLQLLLLLFLYFLLQLFSFFCLLLFFDERLLVFFCNLFLLLEFRFHFALLLGSLKLFYRAKLLFSL